MPGEVAQMSLCEHRLDKLALAPPDLSLAREKAVTQNDSQKLIFDALPVAVLVRHQDVSGCLCAADRDDQASPGLSCCHLAIVGSHLTKRLHEVARRLQDEACAVQTARSRWKRRAQTLSRGTTISASSRSWPLTCRH